jgi:murein DD-endopeptidase MepM/ murein hydrolase activator NlpD
MEAIGRGPHPRGMASRRVRVALLVGALLALGGAGCALPRWPAEGPLTSPFGLRFRSFLPSVHHGVDIYVPTGTPVRTALPGRVRFAGEMRGYGRVIWIDHRRGVITVYAHLSEIRVQRGDRIEGGQVVGLSGATGDVTAPHLHFEVWKGGRPVDPVQFLGRRPSPASDRR